MRTKTKPPPKVEPKPRLGRPPTNPDGSTPRTIRMTATEFAAVLEFLKGLRPAKTA